jgi:glutathionylspermidine synthase
MRSLQDCLVNSAKDRFFDRLSLEAYANLPNSVLTLFEGPVETRRPYIIFDALKVSADFCQTIREASELFWSMATSTAQVFQYLPEHEILDWGFPEDYIPLILAAEMPPSEMRLDIAVNPQAFAKQQFTLDDFKVLEANSATPGFWAETFVLNELLVNHLGYACPNHGCAEVQTLDLINYLRKFCPDYQHGRETVYFSFPYAGLHEDILSFDARIGHFEQQGGKAKFCYVEDLVFETDAARDAILYSLEYEPVKYLFLHYPNEWLIEEYGEIFTDDSLHGIPAARPWDYLQELTLHQKIFRIPPISSELIQNKAFFAFLWEGIHQYRFDPETTQVIQRLVPQTYCTMAEAIERSLHRVWEKPIYGREGAGIILWEQGVELVNTYDPNFEDDEWYQNMLAVFQEDCPMPIHSFTDQDVTLMFTVYLSAMGKATGIGCRAVPTSAQVIDAKQGLWYPLAIAGN